MILKKGQPIGCTDSVFRDICVGDEIVDSQGRRYTVTPYGAAKPLHGSGEIDIKHLKDVTVVIAPGDAHAAAISAQVDKAPEKPAQAAQISTQTEKPGKDTDQAAKAAKRPEFKPHKDNGSGLVDLSNLKRNLPGHTAATLLALAGRLGIPIVLHAERRAVSTADAVRLADEAMQNKPVPVEVKPPVKMKLTAPAKKKLHVYKAPDYKTVTPAVRKRIALQALDDRELVPDDLLLSVAMKRDLVPDEGDVTTPSDQALADELRRRGYTVTAVKHFEL